MLFLLFGGGLRYKVRGPAATRTCPRCRNTTTWIRLRRFHELTLFLVPILRWGRGEVERCPVCGEERAAHSSSPRRMASATAAARSFTPSLS